MADTITADAGQMDAVKQTLISEVVQRELREAVTMLPTVSDFSALARSGYDRISIPKLDSFTVVNRAEGLPGDATALTSSVDTMLLDKNAFVSYLIDSYTSVQSNINIQLEYARRAATAHGRYADAQIIAEMETAGVATTTAGTISRDIILEMREALLTRNANKDQLFLAVGPDSDADLLKVSEFTAAEIYGSSNIPNGMIGRVYGVSVFMCNQLAAGQYFMYERGGLAIAFQQAARVAQQPEIAYGTDAMRFSMDQIFGVKALQLGVNGVLAAQSALIVKDNNL